MDLYEYQLISLDTEDYRDTALGFVCLKGHKFEDWMPYECYSRILVLLGTESIYRCQN